MIRAPRRVIAVVSMAFAAVSAAHADTPTSSSGSSLIDLHDSALALDVTGPAAGQPGISSGASLKLDLPVGSMIAQATASVGRDENDPDLWQKHGAQFQANWSALGGTAFTLSGADNFAFIYRAPASVGDPGTATHLVRTEQQTGKVAASFSVFSNARVEVGAESASTQTQDTTAAQPTTDNRTAVRTDAQNAFASIDWKPAAWLGVQAGAAAHTENITWHALDSRSSEYDSVDPHLSVILTPWTGAAWSATVQHAVQPYDAAAYAAYASVALPSGDVSFEPDRSWRFQTRVQQNFGPLNMAAAYTADRWGTVTEFAETHAGVQAPASAPLLGRDQVDLSLSLPLAMLGMPDTSLSSDAAWQGSRIVDPVTDTIRSASGQTPQKFSLRMVHDLPRSHLSLGLTGQLSGAQTSYQVNEISTVSSGGTLGAFLAYKPGPFEFDLNVNGLCGGPSTTDTFYGGTRADSAMGRVALQPALGPVVNVSLHKAF